MNAFRSAAERETERYRLVLAGAGMTAISRLAGLLLIVLTIHWAAPSLGPERFGIWATFSGLAYAFAFLDLGVGNALINRIARAMAGRSASLVHQVILGGIGWLFTIGAAASIVLLVFSEYTPWAALLKLSSAGLGIEARQGAMMFSVIFGLNVIASGTLKILVGQQRSHEAQAISAATALLACPLTWFAIKLGGNIPWILAGGLGTQALTTLLCAIWLIFRRQRIDWRRLRLNMTLERAELLGTGMVFFVLQLGYAISWGMDTLVVSSILGAADGAAIAVAQRLFLIASQPVAIATSALWPAYADARERGDRPFIRKTLFRSLWLSAGIGFVLSLTLFFWGSQIAALWTSNSVSVPSSLMAAYALWTPFEALGMALGVYLNGTGIVREQVVVVLAFCILALPAKILAASMNGASGLVLATTIVYVVTHFGVYSTIFRTRISAPLRET